MCSLVVIEVCVLPSCGRWSHCVPSVREMLDRIRMDGLVCKRWPPQPAFSCLGLRYVCVEGRAFVSCLMEQHCVTAFNSELPSPLFLSLLSAGWWKRRLRIRLRQSSRRRRSSAWRRRRQMNMSSRNRFVSHVWCCTTVMPEFRKTRDQWLVNLSHSVKGFALL